ncbi:MAG: hypothetical protein GX220_03995 [Treponema sp.]|nr:hypothetical protein [Treponema sp.]
MAKITAENRALFNLKIGPFKTEVNKIFEKEKSMLDLIARDNTGIAYKKFLLAEEMIHVTTIFLTMNNLSVEILDTKNTESLNDGRKAIYKAIIYLEDIVTDYIDVPFSDYSDKVAEISNIPLEKRYLIVRKLGLIIQLIMKAFGENSKWKWSFVEIQGRFATISKNLIDLKEAIKSYFDPRSPDYEVTVYYLRLIKKLLEQSADRYRDRYELSTRRMDDFRLGINYLLAWRRICVLLNENDEAENIKKKAIVWKEKMEADQKVNEKKR